MSIEKVGHNNFLMRINNFSGGLVSTDKIPLLNMQENQFTAMQGCRLDKANHMLRAIPALKDLAKNTPSAGGITVIYNALSSYVSTDTFYTAALYTNGSNAWVSVEDDVESADIQVLWSGTGASIAKFPITFGADAFRFGGTFDAPYYLAKYIPYAGTRFQAQARSAGWYGLAGNNVGLAGFDVYANAAFQDDFTILGTDTTSSDGSFVNGDVVDYAVSVELDDGQESKLIWNRSLQTTIDSNDNYIDVDVKVDLALTHFFRQVRYFHIYRSVNSGDFYLWKSLDTQSRSACYDDSNTSITWVDTANTSSAASNIKDYGLALVDSYESRTGYYGSTRKVSGTAAVVEENVGSRWIIRYKAACMALNRHIIGNIQSDNEEYNDRIYISPPDKYDSFPEERYILVGEDDGDSIQAISSIANRYIVVFKRNNTYIIDASSISETGWYLTKKLATGTKYEKSVTYTDYGLCFTNDDGAWIITNDLKLVELSKNIKWSTYNYSDPSGHYLQKHTEYMVTYTDNDVVTFDLSNGAVFTQALTTATGTTSVLTDGKQDDDQDYRLLLRTAGSVVDIYELDNTHTTYQTNLLATFPINMGRYRGTKFRQLYATYKGAADYGISTSLATGPTAGTNMSDYSTTRGTDKIRLSTTGNFLRIAVDDFVELEEIAVLMSPHSTRRVDNIGGVT